MSDGGKRILDGLRDAVAGNFSRVTIAGQTWTRHDAESPEGRLASARDKIAELELELDVLRATPPAPDAVKELVEALREAVDMHKIDFIGWQPTPRGAAWLAKAEAALSAFQDKTKSEAGS